jgi:hypothetical protein
MSDCGHVLLCQALNATASQDPSADEAYSVLKAPGDAAGTPSSSEVEEQGRTGL